MYSKGNHKQDKKTTLRMRENICKWSNRQGINFQYTNSSCSSITKKHTIEFFKNGQKTFLNRHFFREDIQMANKWEKMLNITIREMQIKIQWVITSHRLEWLSSKILQTINVEKREPSYTVGGNANWYSHYGEQYGGFSKILK